MDNAKTYQQTRTTNFFYKTNLVVYLFGFPNFWIEELKLPKTFINFFNRFTLFNNTLIYIFIGLELGAFFTQHSLTEKQKLNLLVYGFSHPILFFFRGIMAHRRDRVRDVLYDLTVVLKRVHNDTEVESQMMRRCMMYLTALLSTCVLSMLSYTIDAGMDVIRKGLTYTTVITVWPDVEDTSYPADVSRIICNVVWWIFVTRVFGVYILVISLMTCLSYQHKNLQSYFYQLNGIFERQDLRQREKEDRYEKAFKVGIRLHSDTLRCTYQSQSVCGGVFSGQIIFNILVVVVLMAQMVNSERNLVNLCATVFTGSAVLISTGFFMCNSGDVTVEASHLATAMYFSGWHNCLGESSVRIRKLVVVAMSHAQKPVVLRGLGYIELSYQSYITIVKLCYSVFSVLY